MPSTSRSPPRAATPPASMPPGRHHHLFDPSTGRSADRCASVTVLARSAATADALSTALAVLPLAAAPDSAAAGQGHGPLCRVRWQPPVARTRDRPRTMTDQASERAPARNREFPLLAYGFRPFFLLAALFAALAVPLWLAAYLGAVTLAAPLPASLWHGHEMLFGYGTAVLAGFLLTATPGWSGRPPVKGAALAALVRDLARRPPRERRRRRHPGDRRGDRSRVPAGARGRHRACAAGGAAAQPPVPAGARRARPRQSRGPARCPRRAAWRRTDRRCAPRSICSCC